MVPVEAPQPDGLVGAAHFRRRLLGEGEEEGKVGVARRLRLARLQQPLPRILPHRLQEAVAGLVSGEW